MPATMPSRPRPTPAATPSPTAVPYETKTIASCCDDQDHRQLLRHQDQDHREVRRGASQTKKKSREGRRRENCHVSTAYCAACSSLRTGRREETATSVQPRGAVLSAVCCSAVCRCSCCHVRVPQLVVYMLVLCPESIRDHFETLPTRTIGCSFDVHWKLIGCL